jgi:penicillin-binding protein 1A
VEVGRAGEPVKIAGVDVVLPGAPRPRAVSAGTAWQMVEMMRGVVEDGTGRKARSPGKDRGGKTGTSSGYADAWFVGWIPSSAIAIWIGQDDRTSLGNAETGGKTALPAYLKIVEALGEPEGSALRPPPEVLELTWNDRLVGLPADGVPPSLLPWQDPGEAPLPDFPGPVPRDCTTTASR